MRREWAISIATAWFAGLAAVAVPMASAKEEAASAVFVTLGTGGGPRVQTKRAQPANAVIVNGAVYIFDAGEGVQRQLAAAGIDLAQVKAIFVSHHHIDHIGGLSTLLVNRWVNTRYAPLPVIGPPGTTDMIRESLAAARPVELAPVNLAGNIPPLGGTAAPCDLPAAADHPVEIYADQNIRVLAVTNAHYHFPAGSESAATARSYSFRIEAAGGSIVYTGDTGASPQVEELAKGADLLVSEVMDYPAIAASLAKMALPPGALDGILQHLRLSHLTPVEVGTLAARAKVGGVVLTHLVPGLDSDTDASGYVKGLSAEFSGPVVVARDLQRFDPAQFPNGGK